MIDFENEIFTRIRNRVIRDFPGADVDSMENYMPSHFPFVTVVEAENSVRPTERSSGGIENFANLMYEINVYTRGDAKKTTAREIFAAVNDEFLKMGFARTNKTYVTFNSAENFRIVGRFTAAIGADGTTYRR